MIVLKLSFVKTNSFKEINVHNYFFLDDAEGHDSDEAYSGFRYKDIL